MTRTGQALKTRKPNGPHTRIQSWRVRRPGARSPLEAAFEAALATAFASDLAAFSDSLRQKNLFILTILEKNNWPFSDDAQGAAVYGVQVVERSRKFGVEGFTTRHHHERAVRHGREDGAVGDR